MEADPAPPPAALVWRADDECSLVARALSIATPEERYAHLDRWPTSHDAPAPAVIREADLPRAKWAAHPRRVAVHQRAERAGLDAVRS